VARPFKRDVVIFVFFLFLSFGFWYLNSLRKDFELEMRYPVKYVNPPGGRKIDNEIPSKLTFNLKGSGYSIIKLRLSANRYPLVIDFSRVTYRRVPESRGPEYFIVSNSLIPDFSRQLRSEFQILSVKPDTILILFGGISGTGASGKNNQAGNAG